MKRLVFVAAVFGSALTGCSEKALLETQASKLNPCSLFQHHCIHVAVDASASPPIYVDVTDLHMRKRNHFIIWQIDTNGYAFPNNDTDGIKFVTNPMPDSGEFTCGLVPQSGARAFYCKADNSQPGKKYKYTITIQGVTPLDPWIHND